MVPYDAGDHFEQIFLLYVDAGGRSLLIGDCLENCWLATSNSCIKIKGVMVTASVSPLVDLGSILLSMEKKPTGLLGFFGEALIGIPPCL